MSLDTPDEPEDRGRRWAPGDLAVLRYLTRDGRPGMTWATRVVEDRDDLLALFIPEGASYKRWRIDRSGDGPPRRELLDDRWRRDTLRLMYPGRASSIWLQWERDEPGGPRRFRHYYVNLEEPFRRTGIGVDTNDHALDVVVAEDLTWQWKDVEELDRRSREGIYFPAFAKRVRAEAERVIEDIERGAPPFSGEWLAWEPDPSWALPEVPASWETEPPQIWPEYREAYEDADQPRYG